MLLRARRPACGPFPPNARALSVGRQRHLGCSGPLELGPHRETRRQSQILTPSAARFNLTLVVGGHRTWRRIGSAHVTAAVSRVSHAPRAPRVRHLHPRGCDTVREHKRRCGRARCAGVSCPFGSRERALSAAREHVAAIALPNERSFGARHPRASGSSRGVPTRPRNSKFETKRASEIARGAGSTANHGGASRDDSRATRRELSHPRFGGSRRPGRQSIDVSTASFAAPDSARSTSAPVTRGSRGSVRQLPPPTRGLALMPPPTPRAPTSPLYAALCPDATLSDSRRRLGPKPKSCAASRAASRAPL